MLWILFFCVGPFYSSLIEPVIVGLVSNDHLPYIVRI